MTRFHQLAGAVLLASSVAIAADVQLPKAEVILDRYVEVTGGRAAYEKHRTEVHTLSMEFVGKGIKGSGTRYADGNKLYDSMTLEGVGKIEAGISNGVAWETNPITGPRVLQGEEKATRIRDARFNAPLHWKEMFKSAETTGMDTVNGDECYKVVLTPAEGKPETNYFSKKTGLLVRKSHVAVNPMGEVPVDIYVKEYKTFGGVLTPAKISQQVMGNEILITLEDAKLDVDIPASQFDPPEDIKKLLAK